MWHSLDKMRPVCLTFVNCLSRTKLQMEDLKTSGSSPHDRDLFLYVLEQTRGYRFVVDGTRRHAETQFISWRVAKQDRQCILISSAPGPRIGRGGLFYYPGSNAEGFVAKPKVVW